jgi:hypothetical protein
MRYILIIAALSLIMLAGCHRTQVSNDVLINDSMLSDDKAMCSPLKGKALPFCNDLYKMDPKTGKPLYNQTKYDIVRGNCPGAEYEAPEDVRIYKELVYETATPKGKSRVASYCYSTNQFWVVDYDSLKANVSVWYGPFTGYPKVLENKTA